jgi:hypothetical protein
MMFLMDFIPNPRVEHQLLDELARRPAMLAAASIHVLADFPDFA